MSVSHVTKLLALAASAALIGSPRECEAATINAARIAARCGLDICELADTYGVSLLCTIPWTEEKAPSDLGPCTIHNVVLADGSGLCIYEAVSGAGVWIERLSSDATGNQYLGRGFWRDCEIAEAVWFAREAWGC
jgi:hypothetical protein